jgi:hypothetical protein
VTSPAPELTPILGEEDANALMSEFPGSEGDELVTQSFLRAEIAGLRAELTQQFADIRADMASLETRLTVRMGAMGVVILSAMFGLKLFA